MCDGRPRPQRLSPRSGAVRLGPRAQFRQVQCPCGPTSFTRGPGPGEAAGTGESAEGSGQPRPVESPAQSPACFLPQSPVGPSGRPGRSREGRLSSDHSGLSWWGWGSGQSQDQNPSRQIWLRDSRCCCHPLSKAALTGSEHPVAGVPARQEWPLVGDSADRMREGRGQGVWTQARGSPFFPLCDFGQVT